jgi:hypothetical protein
MGALSGAAEAGAVIIAPLASSAAANSFVQIVIEFSF